MPNVVFYHKDFSEAEIPLNLEGVIERYSCSMLGGPESFTLKIDPTSDKWELLKLLRCPVKVIGDDGGEKWWGFVNRVVVPQGKNRVGLGLDNMFNAISIQYSGGVTAVASDAQSDSEFGTKQFFIDYSNLDHASAVIKRDNFLVDHRVPKDEPELSGGDPQIVIECLGWWKTLGWLYYSNPSTTPVDNALQVRDIILACGQFIRGVIVEDLAGFASAPRRDGRNTALNYATELLNAGSVNGRRMLATVDRNRVVHIYEQASELPEILVNDDGNFETLLGSVVESQNCVHAVWAKVEGVPNTINRGLTTLGTFFVDQAEYIETDEAAGNVY